MTSVVPLALLNGLDEVDLSNNKISEAKVGTAPIPHLPCTDTTAPLHHFFSFLSSIVQELAPFLQYTPYLRKMDFRGNPFCKKPKYRDQIVMMSQSLCE